jgi:hypothetical protein
LPSDGQSDWDVPLNAALDEIVDAVNDNETAIAGKANTSHTHGVSDLTATGTPSSTTFLRGDNTWATPAGGGGGGVSSVNGDSGPSVTLDQDDIGDGTTYKQYSGTEKTKLAGIATGATANSSDATLLDRANHTGTQNASTIGAGTMATARLGSGTASSSTFLRGDQTWATPAGGGSGATGAMVYLNAATLASASGARTVLLDTVEFADTGFSYNTTTGELTVPTTGWYTITAKVRLNASATGFNFISVLVNGANSFASHQVSASTFDMVATAVDKLTAGDVVTLNASTGSSVQIQGGLRSRTLLRVVHHP